MLLRAGVQQEGRVLPRAGGLGHWTLGGLARSYLSSPPCRGGGSASPPEGSPSSCPSGVQAACFSGAVRSRALCPSSCPGLPLPLGG